MVSTARWVRDQHRKTGAGRSADVRVASTSSEHGEGGGGAWPARRSQRVSTEKRERTREEKVCVWFITKRLSGEERKPPSTQPRFSVRCAVGAKAPQAVTSHDLALPGRSPGPTFLACPTAISTTVLDRVIGGDGLGRDRYSVKDAQQGRKPEGNR